MKMVGIKLDNGDNNHFCDINISNDDNHSFGENCSSSNNMEVKTSYFQELPKYESRTTWKTTLMSYKSLQSSRSALSLSIDTRNESHFSVKTSKNVNNKQNRRATKDIRNFSCSSQQNESGTIGNVARGSWQSMIDTSARRVSTGKINSDTIKSKKDFTGQIRCDAKEVNTRHIAHISKCFIRNETTTNACSSRQNTVASNIEESFTGNSHNKGSEKLSTSSTTWEEEPLLQPFLQTRNSHKLEKHDENFDNQPENLEMDKQSDSEETNLFKDISLESSSDQETLPELYLSNSLNTNCSVSYAEKLVGLSTEERNIGKSINFPPSKYPGSRISSSFPEPSKALDYFSRTLNSTTNSISEGNLKENELDFPENLTFPPLFQNQTLPKEVDQIPNKFEVYRFDKSSLESLLHEIYRRPNGSRRQSSVVDSDSTCESLLFHQKGCICRLRENKLPLKYRKQLLLTKDVLELFLMRNSLSSLLTSYSSSLIKELKKKDKNLHMNKKKCDVITAILHALSPKRKEDTKIKFSVEPIAGASGFSQWLDSMKMCASLPGGIPKQFRKQVWTMLSEDYIRKEKLDWKEIEKNSFSEWASPDDENLGEQIVKDLHRTGCSTFCGDDSEENQALLKKVLLGYARWNKMVGYCQGLNVLAAITLEVMDRDEVNTLKVLIYLIEGVLPESYFTNNLRGLAVDMTVFRELMKVHLPELATHLEILREKASDQDTGGCYEPPIINVFTMQWFLTLFANCLHRDLVIRIWDLILLYGNEIILRTALANWSTFSSCLMQVPTADKFYGMMGNITRKMLTPDFLEPDQYIQTLMEIGSFPFPDLADLRDRFTYNITPWSLTHLRTIQPEEDEDDYSSAEPVQMQQNIAAVFGLTAICHKTGKHLQGCVPSINSGDDLFRVGDGSCHNLDISDLKKQYKRLKQRQKQAYIILKGSSLATERSKQDRSRATKNSPKPNSSTMTNSFRDRMVLRVRQKPIGLRPNFICANLTKTQVQIQASSKEMDGNSKRMT